MLSEIYAHVRVRRVVLVGILGLIATLLFGWMLWPDLYLSEFREPGIELALLELTLYGFTGLLIWHFCGQNCEIRKMFGPWPNRREVWIYLTLGIPMIGIGVLGRYLLFGPLSYVAPTFVSEWYLDTPPAIFMGTYSLEAILVNGLAVLHTALLVPIVEEIVVRGFILHRWCDKYSETKGIVLSSILFSVLHSEILGNFVGAVIVSVLCLCTKSLVGPILIHIGNNSAIMLVVVVFWLMGGDMAELLASSTLEEFRSTWWLAPIGAAVGIPWLYWFVKTRLLESNSSH